MKKTMVVFFLIAAGWASAGAQEFSTGRRIGMAALNPILGLGSYLMKDWVGGAIVTALEGAAVGCIFWERSLDKDDAAYLRPGVAAFALGGTAVVFGIIKPFFYHRTFYHRTRSARRWASLMEGLDIGLVQAADTPRGTAAPAVHIRYSFQY